MIEREERTTTSMTKIDQDAAGVRRRANMRQAGKSVVVLTARSAERNLERRTIPLECLLTSAVSGAKKRLAKKGTKDVRDVVKTNLATRRMRGVKNVEESDAANVSMTEAKFAVPRARQLCLKQSLILSSSRLQMMISRLQP
jgi:hypothetical protein